ncbi:unnamed protein product [Rhizopus stolonifer]
MSLLNKSLYAYNPDDMIDLDGVFNEGSSQLISLSSIDDQQLNELTRQLVTPTPNSKYQGPPSSYPESVLLFRDLKHDKTTVDLVSSDLKDFMCHYDMDDLASKAPTRIENSRLNLLRRAPSTIHRRSPLQPKQDKRSQLLSALEQSYHREQQTEQIYLEQLREIDPKAYERLKRDSEKLMKRRSFLLQQFRKGNTEPQKTRSSENSTSTTSSHSNEVYYDPPESKKKNKKNDDIYPQDSISSSNEPLSSEAKNSAKAYQNQLEIIRSASTEEKKKREEDRQKPDALGRLQPKQNDHLSRPKRDEPTTKPNNSYLARPRKSTEEAEPKNDHFKRLSEDPYRKRRSFDFLGRLPQDNEKPKVSIDSYLIRPRKSTEEPKQKLDSYLARPRKSAEESKTSPTRPRRSVDYLGRPIQDPTTKDIKPRNSFSSIPRKSIEEPKQKMDYLNRSPPRRSSEESKVKVSTVDDSMAQVNTILTRHRRSVEESNRKVDTILNRPRRNTDESKSSSNQHRKSITEPPQTRRNTNDLYHKRSNENIKSMEINHKKLQELENDYRPQTAVRHQKSLEEIRAEYQVRRPNPAEETRGRVNNILNQRRINVEEEQNKSDREIALSYLTRGQQRNEQTEMSHANHRLSFVKREEQPYSAREDYSSYPVRDNRYSYPQREDYAPYSIREDRSYPQQERTFQVREDRYSYSQQQEHALYPVREDHSYSQQQQERSYPQQYDRSHQQERSYTPQQGCSYGQREEYVNDRLAYTPPERRVSVLKAEEPKRSYIQSYGNKRNSQDVKRNEGKEVTESARRVLAMVQESRMKRLGIQNNIH